MAQTASFYTGRVVAITGAASGIGRQIAIQAASAGARLAVTDLSEAGLQATVKALELAGADVHAQALDVADYAEMQRFAESTKDKFGSVDAIFNVAGVLYSGSVMATPVQDFNRVVATNLGGVVNGSKAFLPVITESSTAGRICNVSSAFGLMASPNSAAYNASKFAVRGFTEALAQEMRAEFGNRVRVTCGYPGGVKTSIAETARVAPGVDHRSVADTFDRLARTAPDVAAGQILHGVAKGALRVLIGPDARAVDIATRSFGPGYMRVIPWVRERL
jgi:NAD(P)-dependent dehydrogenase (short-subunit alcohol dehydrogenase family)